MTIEVGTRLYCWGRHYEVVGLTTRDNEPAVRLQEKGAKRPDRIPVCTSLLLRRAIPSLNWD